MLVISQVYVPDPAAVGQYMAEAAEAMVARGFDVRVLTSARGYADPDVKYPSRETLGGVEVVRLPLSSFGKKTLVHRLAGQLSFLLQVMIRGLFTPRLASVVVSTAPPMAGAAALLLKTLRGASVTFWVMDLNVDQLIANGTLRRGSLFGRMLKGVIGRTLRRADEVVVLDRFMQQRVAENYGVTSRVHVIPPWPLEERLSPVDHVDNSFRDEHGLQGKFVFMYSGNMGIGHPIGVLLEAAAMLEDLPEVVVLFIGDGVRRPEVERAVAERPEGNLRLLPYQPLERLRYSLSAADVHLATMESSGLGYFHPCKVYGAMAVARPILVAGPDPSHMTDLIRAYNIGWSVPDDDPQAIAQQMRSVAESDPTELRQRGDRARQAVLDDLSKDVLRDRFCDLVASHIPATAS